MLLAYTIDVPRRLVRITADRYPSLDEWFETMDAATSDPRYGPGFDVLYDRTRARESPDAARVRRWVARYAKLAHALGGPRLAVIVGTPALYGLGRMAAVYAESAGASVGVFWSEREALEWLGRSPNSSVA